MQIKMLASRFAAGGALSYVAGTTYEVANDLALQFIGDNAAVEVNGSRAAATDCLRDEFSKPEGIAGIALVSGDVIVFAGAVDPEPNSKVVPLSAARLATAAINDALLSQIIAANTTTAIQIEFTQPFVFSAQQTARSSVQLVGRGKASQITFAPSVSNLTWFVWSRNSADASQVMEELQLIGCGIRNLYVRSDRSIRANAFYMYGVDFPTLDVEIFGFKGYGLRMSNCRVGGGTKYTSYYNGYTDLADGTNNVPDLWIDSVVAAWDGSNLLSVADVQIYYPFGMGIKTEGAYSLVLGGSSLVVHQLARADTDFETNFLVAFPYYNGAASALGFTAGSVARNEYAAHHVGFASAPSVSGRLWQANHAFYNYGMHSTCDTDDNTSTRNRLGQGRFIGGQTLYTVFIEGESDVQFVSSEITSASAFAANITCDAGSDVWTSTGVIAASMTGNTVPPSGTPFFMPTSTTAPGGTDTSQAYYIIRLSSTTFQASKTYAGCFAAVVTGAIDAAGILTVSAFTSGILKAGQVISGAGVAAGTKLLKRLSGSRVNVTNGTSRWQTNTPGVVASTTITAALTPIDITSTGASVVVYAGGLTLGVLDGSSAVVDTRSYFDNSAAHAWHDDTSRIIGNARTGPLYTYLPVSRQESPEQMLFMARSIPVDATGDITQLQKLFGGRRYITTRITVQQKSAATAAGATVALWTAAGGTGTNLVAAVALASLGSANTTQTLTFVPTGAVPWGSDSTANVNVPPYFRVTVAGAAGAVVDLLWWGYPAD